MKKKEKQEVLDIREDIPIRRYDKQRNVFSGRMEATAIFIRSFQGIW